MSATSLRATALRRSHARDFVNAFLNEDQLHTHDITGIVMELADSEDQDFDTMDAQSLYAIIARHEYDENGLTDAALAKALANSQTGWVIMIRRPGEDVQTMNWENAKYETPEAIEALLREFSRFPEGTSIMVLPLVG